MRQNEKEMPQIIKLAKKLRVNELSLKTVSVGRPTDVLERLERFKKYVPQSAQYRRYDFIDNEIFIKNTSKLCDWVAKGFVYWNGDIGSCCYDFNGDNVVGNIFESKGFKKLWYSSAYARLRKRILLKQLSLCKWCNATSDYGMTIKIS
jgi:MoaA/NifB/PqqE/SkfB family radical SAM enzyme